MLGNRLEGRSRDRMGNELCLIGLKWLLGLFLFRVAKIGCTSYRKFNPNVYSRLVTIDDTIACDVFLFLS